MGGESQSPRTHQPSRWLLSGGWQEMVIGNPGEMTPGRLDLICPRS